MLPPCQSAGEPEEKCTYGRSIKRFKNVVCVPLPFISSQVVFTNSLQIWFYVTLVTLCFKHNNINNDLQFSPNIIRVTNSRMVNLTEHVTYMVQTIYVGKIVFVTIEGQVNLKMQNQIRGECKKQFIKKQILGSQSGFVRSRMRSNSQLFWHESESQIPF